MENNKTELVENILQKIKLTKDSIKINGVNFNKDAEERFNQVKNYCENLFKTNTLDLCMKINEPTKEMPYASIEINMSSFGINEKNKDGFIELIQLSDEIVFPKDDTVSMIFYVNDIWTE